MNFWIFFTFCKFDFFSLLELVEKHFELFWMLTEQQNKYTDSFRTSDQKLSKIWPKIDVKLNCVFKSLAWIAEIEKDNKREKDQKKPRFPRFTIFSGRRYW